MKKTITSQMREDAKVAYNDYQIGFNYSIDKRRNLINEQNFYFDIHRQCDAIDAIVALICDIDGKFNALSDLFSDKLINAKNERTLADNEIRQYFDLFSNITNVVNHKEELFILQDILNRKTELIRDIENDCGMSEILKG